MTQNTNQSDGMQYLYLLGTVLLYIGVVITALSTVESLGIIFFHSDMIFESTYILIYLLFAGVSVQTGAALRMISRDFYNFFEHKVKEYGGNTEYINFLGMNSLFVFMILVLSLIFKEKAFGEFTIALLFFFVLMLIPSFLVIFYYKKMHEKYKEGRKEK